MARRRLLTISSDVGALYSAQIKGVLLHFVAPDALVELTHELPAHQVVEGAFLFRQMVERFPARAVHLAIVDPGVGGPRAPIAISCENGAVLVGPDNGLLIPARDRWGGGTAVRLDPRRVGAVGEISATFEGRDLFAPAAGRIATGVRPSALGAPWEPMNLTLPEATRRSGTVDGEVAHIDRFGNLITNVPTEWIPLDAGRMRLTLAGSRGGVIRRVRTYAELDEDELGVLGSSFGTLEISVREGRAVERGHPKVGARVRLWTAPGGSRSPKAPK
ncbi:MAG: SAM-dependent chlorinase/fluorinase [Thermoplasmata archaeon]|nr:SAM-dependent chlorinase/fluorinase [Thermoplasmata archaeon]